MTRLTGTILSTNKSSQYVFMFLYIFSKSVISSLLVVDDGGYEKYTCTGEQQRAIDFELQNCDRACEFGTTFELSQETIVSSLDLSIEIHAPVDSPERMEFWLNRGVPPLGLETTPKNWTTQNYIATIFNTATNSFRGGGCHHTCQCWHKFDLEDSIKLPAGKYTVSMQWVDDNGMYETDCRAHHLLQKKGLDMIWYRSTWDQSDSRAVIHYQNDALAGFGGGFFEYRHNIGGIRVNSGSLCSAIGK